MNRNEKEPAPVPPAPSLAELDARARAGEAMRATGLWKHCINNATDPAYWAALDALARDILERKENPCR